MQNHQYDTPAINGAVTKIAGGVSDKYAILLQIKVLRSRVCIRMQSQHNSGAMLYLCWNFSPIDIVNTTSGQCCIDVESKRWNSTFVDIVNSTLGQCCIDVEPQCWISTKIRQITTKYRRDINVESMLKHQYWQSTWFQHISMLYQCCVLLGTEHKPDKTKHVLLELLVYLPIHIGKRLTPHHPQFTAA